MVVDGRKTDPELVVSKRQTSGRQAANGQSPSGNQVQTSGEIGGKIKSGRGFEGMQPLRRKLKMNIIVYDFKLALYSEGENS